MSGGDDPNQYCNRRVYDAPDEEPQDPPEVQILRIVRQHGIPKTMKWIDQATLKVQAEERQRKAAERRNELARLKGVVEDGEAAKKRIEQLTREVGT